MSPEQKRKLEELRELSTEIERLYEHHRNVPRPAGKRALLKEIAGLKRERRELVGSLNREGVEALVIAPAADLTRAAVAKLGRSG